MHPIRQVIRSGQQIEKVLEQAKTRNDDFMKCAAEEVSKSKLQIKAMSLVIDSIPSLLSKDAADENSTKMP